MNSKERINSAMDLQPVDQTPFMCQMSVGHMLMQLGCSPVEFWFDKDVYMHGIIQLREQYDFDGILISLYGHDPKWKEKITQITKTEESEIALFENGDKIICPYNELPYYEYCADSTKYDLAERNFAQEKRLSYFPVSNNLSFYINQEYPFTVIEEVVEKVGKKYSIHGEITSPFDYLLDYLGYQNALSELLINPQNVKLILDHFTGLISDLSIQMCKTGIDAIKISSPFAGSGFISPDQYLEFVFPYEKKIINAIRENNVHAYVHTCGAINDRLEYMFENGSSGIECLDPKPLGNVDLEEAVVRVGEMGFIKGNIDSVNLLLNSSIKTIKAEINQIIEVGSKASGFILSTACSIAPNVKKENIQAIRNVIDNIPSRQ